MDTTDERIHLDPDELAEAVFDHLRLYWPGVLSIVRDDAAGTIRIHGHGLDVRIDRAAVAEFVTRE